MAKNLSRRAFIGTSSAALGAMIAGCQSAPGAAKTSAKRVATFCCDVTPPLGTPIYSSYKPLETVEYPLLAKGIILEDNGQRYVLCTVDYCELRNSTHRLFRKALADAAGTDIAQVAVQTVHQHTAPLADSDGFRFLESIKNPPPFPPVKTFEEPAGRLAEAAAKALAKLEPYNQVGLGQGRVERVASNRRVPLGDGTVGFRASSCRDPKLIEAPEGLIDPFLKTITFAQDGRPRVRLHYYATHPQSYYGDPRASYDFVGIARETLQEREGVFQVYFTGCSGDVAAGKYNDGKPETRPGLAARMLQGMEASVAATEYRPAEPIHWTTTPLLLEARQDAGFTEADCRAQMADESKGAVARSTPATILGWLARADQPVELSALHMGKLSILHLPGEPAIAYQLYAQEQAPDRFVAVAGYGDAAHGYLCLEHFYAEGGYEPTASNVKPDSEARVRTAIRELLAG